MREGAWQRRLEVKGISCPVFPRGRPGEGHQGDAIQVYNADKVRMVQAQAIWYSCWTPPYHAHSLSFS